VLEYPLSDDRKGWIKSLAWSDFDHALFYYTPSNSYTLPITTQKRAVPFPARPIRRNSRKSALSAEFSLHAGFQGFAFFAFFLAGFTGGHALGFGYFGVGGGGFRGGGVGRSGVLSGKGACGGERYEGSD
jgi:hypothetical protein